MHSRESRPSRKHHRERERGGGGCCRGRALLLSSTCPSCVSGEFVMGRRIGHGRTGINWVHGLRGCGELHAVVLVPPWCLYASRAGVCATQNTGKDPSAGFAITSASRRSFQIRDLCSGAPVRYFSGEGALRPGRRRRGQLGIGRAAR